MAVPDEKSFLEHVEQVAMVIGPVSGYLHQYYTMAKMKTSLGFSSATCGVLIVSSITRIFFWIGERFDNTLLYQSILMIVVQLFLLELCVRYFPWPVQIPAPVTHNNTLGGSGNNSGNSTSTLSTTTLRHSTWFIKGQEGGRDAKSLAMDFWKWTSIGPYFLFLAMFTLVLGLTLLVAGDSPAYVEFLGIVALGIEATVPMPQAFQNYRLKSTAGFSPAILLMWVFGDAFKTYYYVTTEAKYQFLTCGIIQLCVDFIVIGQTIVYSRQWRGYRAVDGASGESNVEGTGLEGRPSTEALLSSRYGHHNQQGDEEEDVDDEI